MTEAEILSKYNTIAVVGLTSDETRPAYSVSEYMKRAGYRIIPVTPSETEVLGERAYPDLKSIPDPIEIVDIFKRSEDIGPWVDEAIDVGAKVVWMQLGIENEAAAGRARAAGLEVVMDRCVRTIHRRMTAE